MADFIHADLCQLAANWLKRSLSAKGHGCQIAFTETRTSFLAGESPDAIGFRVAERRYGGGATVVECKVSRADFLADAKKPHRAEGSGMGRFRYYLCPEDLIVRTEIPPGWGLVYVGAKRRIDVICGATLCIREPGSFDLPHDAFSEMMLLANLLHRVGDADRLNNRLRAADAQNGRLSRMLEREREHARNLRAKLFEYQMAALASKAEAA
jgi:hypothetical protein